MHNKLCVGIIYLLITRAHSNYFYLLRKNIYKIILSNTYRIIPNPIKYISHVVRAFTVDYNFSLQYTI